MLILSVAISALPGGWECLRHQSSPLHKPGCGFRNDNGLRVPVDRVWRCRARPCEVVVVLLSFPDQDT